MVAGILYMGEPDIYPEHRMVYRGVPFILEAAYTIRSMAMRRANQLETTGRKTYISEEEVYPETAMQHMDVVDLSGNIHRDGRMTPVWKLWKTQSTHMGHRRDDKKSKPKPKRKIKKCRCK